MSYQKPSLQELYSEIYLPAGSLPVSRLIDAVAALRQQGFSDVDMGNLLTIKKVEEKDLAPSPVFRCWSTDRKRLLQLSPDLVIANQIAPYQGWQQFLDLFRTAQKAAIGNLAVETVSLNTIDSWKVPLQGFSVGRYLNCDGSRFPTYYGDVDRSFDVNLGVGFVERDGFNRHLLIQGRREQNEFEFKIMARFHDSLKSRQLEGLLEELHNESNELFESLLTDETRVSVLGGVIEHAST